ncbi:ABC transporter permease [Calorimonas adulescens]|jgi:Branched-chain amino acid transport system / permease component.|uniref:Ribose ABC transporter permease n=1 Tax=Calorimonas adulescens TaxID=2606906 RepID=A0A5D8Q841_9THEO|nr:ribose ABC transporter permease [Calorimonas adulescens]
MLEETKSRNWEILLRNMQSFIGLIILCVALSILSPRFLTAPNILNVLRQTSLNAVIAIGMTFVILTGGIDLSVGSVLAFSSIVAAGMAHSGVSATASILVGLIIGTVLGFINGLAVTKGDVPPFIATLAMMTMARGATLVYSNGQPKTGLGDGFYFLGNARIMSIPFPVIVLFIVFIIAYYLLGETATGRYVYATGSNENAAKLTGIKTDRIKMLVYSISGFTAALSGMIVTSMLNSAPPTAGTGAELDAIAAVVLGGTSLSGGQGGVIGTIIGALIIGVLNNGLNLLNVSSYYQQLIKGAVILMAVLIDRRRR